MMTMHGSLGPQEAFAVDCARKIGGAGFESAVFAEIGRTYLEEAKKNPATNEQIVLSQIERELDKLANSSA